MLNYETYGDDTANPPIVIVHGLFGSARNWGVIAKRLSDTRRVIPVDQRNHGESFHADSHSYHDMAADLAEVITHLGGQADVIGHSMGGKAAMVLALTQPELVRRLLIADIAPVSYEHTQLHLVEAMQALDLKQIHSRKDADEALAAYVDEKAVRAFLLQSLDPRKNEWDLNLPALRAEMDRILAFPEMTGTFDGPTLFLAGEQSDYIQREHRARIKELFPNAKQAKIPEAGHWLHAERPRAFEAAARTFLGG